MKECRDCHALKPVEDYYRNPKNRDGLYTRCKSCHVRITSKSSLEYKRKHPDKRREYDQRAYWHRPEETRRKMLDSLRAWNAEHPGAKYVREQRRNQRKKDSADGTLTAQQWEAIKAAHDYRCVYCGRKPRELTTDHVIPLVRGGPHAAWNVVPACRKCNEKKGTKRPGEMQDWPA